MSYPNNRIKKHITIEDIKKKLSIKRHIEQDAYHFYEKYSGEKLARDRDNYIFSQGRNDALDAFRHAYTSGRVTQLSVDNQWVAKYYGNDNEIGPDHRNDPYEHRMDLWNNEIGRRIGDAVFGKEELAKQVYKGLKDGDLALDLDDHRLKNLYPDDPRLKLPLDNDERLTLTKEDVAKINLDIERQLDHPQKETENPFKFDWTKEPDGWFDSYPDFSEAEQYASPIIFDLDGDGVKTLALAATRHFDLDNSGFAEQTAWVSSGDGLLVRDLDGNGKIESGAELFGDHTALGDGTNAANGYAALAQYDDNGDGLIDAEDAIWQQLQVWRDDKNDASRQTIYGEVLC